MAKAKSKKIQIQESILRARNVKKLKSSNNVGYKWTFTTGHSESE